MTDAGGNRPRMTGKVVHDPVRAAQIESARQNIRDTVHDFVEGLPIGDSGRAEAVTPYAQPDGSTCFYGSLAGIAASIHGNAIDLRGVGSRAKHEGLLAPTGAETNTDEFQEAQVRFVHREMGIDISFLNIVQRPDQERVHAITHDLIEGRYVVFGLPGHWVALDGIRKYGRGRDEATWTGMDPSGGRTIQNKPRAQQLPPSLIAERLFAPPHMPIVVVNQRPRFKPLGIRHANTSPAPVPRFRGLGNATPDFRPIRRITRAE